MITRRVALSAAAAAILLEGTAGADARQAQTTISPNGSRLARKGAPDHFSGSVRVDPLFQAQEPNRTGAASVTFEPGARTHWHTHPLGQTLIVAAALGWIQSEGGPVEEVGPGDVVWFPAGVRHWHGATPTTPMTHIAVQESLDGKNVNWLESVADAQYRK